MAKYVQLRNPNDKKDIKDFKLGWSWTGFFFGPFVPFFRNEAKYGWYGIFVYPFGWFFVNLWMAAMYNGYYVKRKYEKQGWIPVTKKDEEVLRDYIYLNDKE